MVIDGRCSVCNKLTPTYPSRWLLYEVCKRWRHLKCTILTDCKVDVFCTKCISNSLSFLNIHDDVHYNVSIGGTDGSCRNLDITNII